MPEQVGVVFVFRNQGEPQLLGPVGVGHAGLLVHVLAGDDVGHGEGQQVGQVFDFGLVLLEQLEVTQMTVSRARQAGTHHLMTGMNPVYIFSAGGGKE